MDLGCYEHDVGCKITWICWKLLNCIFASITSFLVGNCKLISPFTISMNLYWLGLVGWNQGLGIGTGGLQFNRNSVYFKQEKQSRYKL